MAKKIFGLTVLVVISFSMSLACAQDFSTVPKKGRVNLVDLGAQKCIPCKMMAPIMEKLEKTYDGKAHIVFIDVWENREQAHRFGIKAIPTQIFFNENGKEAWRHEGFLDEKAIVDRLTQMGVEQPEPGNKE